MVLDGLPLRTSRAGRPVIVAEDMRLIAEWVADRCPYLELEERNGRPIYSALGWMGEDGQLRAAVVYDGYTRINIDMHIAAEPGATWFVPFFVGEAFRYPFEQLNVRRVTAKTPANNAASIKFGRALGFRPEGRIRQALPGGVDLCIFGMLRDECRWLHVGRVNDGQRLSAA